MNADYTKRLSEMSAIVARFYQSHRTVLSTQLQDVVSATEQIHAAFEASPDVEKIKRLCADLAALSPAVEKMRADLAALSPVVEKMRADLAASPAVERFDQLCADLESLLSAAARIHAELEASPAVERFEQLRAELAALSPDIERICAELEALALDSLTPDAWLDVLDTARRPIEAVLHIPADPYPSEIRVAISDSVLAKMIKLRLCYCGEQPDIRQEPCPSSSSRAGGADEAQSLCDVCVFIAKYLPDAQDW